MIETIIILVLLILILGFIVGVLLLVSRGVEKVLEELSNLSKKIPSNLKARVESGMDDIMEGEGFVYLPPESDQEITFEKTKELRKKKNEAAK